MSYARLKELFVAYHGSHLLFILFLGIVWMVPYVVAVPSWFIYVPLCCACIPVAYTAVHDLAQGSISSEVFLSIAAIIGVAGGEEAAVFVVLMIMLVAHYIDALIQQRTDDAVSQLVDVLPQVVTKVMGKQEKNIPLQDVQIGMQLRIVTGERIAVDGHIVSGEGRIQEAMLTGESVPQVKGPGERVYAGTYVEGGGIIMQVDALGDDTMFGKIRTLLDSTDTESAHIVQLAHRITSIFTPLFLSAIALVWLLTGDSRMVITLLVFGSPLELTLVTPLTMLAATVAAFRKGILVKSGAVLEYLSYATTIIFDKTGTLTMGSPEVVAIEPLTEGYSAQDILQLSAIAEKKSGHVLASAIKAQARKEGLEVPDPDYYEDVTGHGVMMRYQGTQYVLGNKHFIEAKEHAHLVLPEESDSERYLTTIYLADDTQVLGKLYVADRIKGDARATIDALRARGMSTIILLSGDKSSIAQAVGHELGITQAYGGVMPDKKRELLTELQQGGNAVVMVGDGINDAPALRQAQIGIAIGSMGMEPAIQAADIVLMADDLDQIVYLYDLSHAAMKTIKQNLLVGFGLTHAVGIALALASYLSPIQAALFHAVPDIFMVLRAARLMRFEGGRV